MIKRHYFGYAVLPVVLLLILSAAAEGQGRGGYAGVFLRLGLGARAKAMGGAYVGKPVDGYSGYYNPAGLANLEKREAAFSYRSLSLDRSFQYAGYSAPLPPMAGISLGWIHAGVDDIDGRDRSGQHTRMYSDGQNGFLFGFGLKLPKNVSIGIGGTYLRETLLDITATGLGINFGVHYKPHRLISLGLAIRDIGAHYTWNTESLYEHGTTTQDDFPVVTTGGAAFEIERYHSTIYVDVFRDSKSDAGLRIGVENRTLETLLLRAGLDDGNITAGAGILFPITKYKGRLDYAIGTSDIDPESAHIVSFSIIF